MDEKLLAAMISGVVALVGISVTAVFSILNYFESRRKAQAERTAERRKALTAALTEFYGPPSVLLGRHDGVVRAPAGE